MATRRQNHGLRKICKCSRKRWGECPHSWHLNYKWESTHHRFSLDRHVGRHIHGKTEALATAEKIRAAIRSGAAPNGTVATPPISKAVTLDQFTAVYLQRAVNNRSNDVSRFKRLCGYELESGDRFGDQHLKAVTEDDLEVFVDDLRADGLAAHTVNHYIQDLKAAFRWAAEKSYLDKDPISGRSKKLKRQRGNRRSRRLVGDEEHRLIAAASYHLQRLIIAALETGARHGELLALEWRDIDFARGEITFRAEITKDKENRHVPISDRLRAVLEMVPRHDPAGDPFGDHDFVFGNEIGEKTRSVQKAWQGTVVRMQGHTPKWHPRTKRLQPESRAVYRSADLRFHDLRHEAGSRWLEAGMSIHHVKALLGHANISTTDTYLNATKIGLHEAMKRIDKRRQDDEPSPMPTTEHQDTPPLQVN